MRKTFFNFIISCCFLYPTAMVGQGYQVPAETDSEIFNKPALPVVETDGKYTYHGVSISVDTEVENFANLVFFNSIVPKGAAEHITFQDVRGLSLVVHVQYGDGDIPDIMTVVPPEGFVAIPESLSVDENTSGTIKIYAMLLG